LLQCYLVLLVHLGFLGDRYLLSGLVNPLGLEDLLHLFVLAHPEDLVGQLLQYHLLDLPDPEDLVALVAQEIHL